MFTLRVNFHGTDHVTLDWWHRGRRVYVSCQVVTPGACFKSDRPPTTTPSSGLSLSRAGTSASTDEDDVYRPTAGTITSTTHSRRRRHAASVMIDRDTGGVTVDDGDDSLNINVDNSSRLRWLSSTTSTVLRRRQQPPSTTSPSTSSESTSGCEHKTALNATARHGGLENDVGSTKYITHTVCGQAQHADIVTLRV